MNKPFILFFSALCLVGCGHAAQQRSPGEGPPGEGLPGGHPPKEVVLERGGELADSDAIRAVVSVTADKVVVWGVTEVPDGSRMQMALAGVDAITRSELLKAIEVRTMGVVTSGERSDSARQTVVVETVEAVSGALTQMGPLPHGWARVRQGDKIVLRLWARLEVPRAMLESAVQSTLARAGQGNAASLIDGLTTAPKSKPEP
jgi:hypothetical protein